MRKTTLLLASLAAMFLASGVALAATVRCEGDECKGTRNADKMLGTSRRDVMYAFKGNDKLYARTGDDDLYGSDGNDLAKGGADNDSLYGDWGVDHLYGMEGSDFLDGGSSHDALYGGEGDDELFANGGGPYSDELSGGKGDDLLDGGDGNTSFYFGPGWGHDTITGNPELRLYLSFYYIPPESVWRRNETVVYVRSDLTIDLNAGDGPEATDGTNTINWDETVDVSSIGGSTGDDKLTGDGGDNSLGGGAGADRIDSRGGDDYVYGGIGGDIIRSGNGDDRVYAFDRQSDSGVDRVNCGAGDRDVVYIQEANADNVANCEDVRFRSGGGGGY